MELGERIATLREERALTQVELAKAARISASTLSQIESGKVPRPHVGTIRKIARALGIEPAALRSIEEPALPKAKTPLPDITQERRHWKEEAEQFISEHEPFLHDDSLTEVASGELVRRANIRMKEVHQNFSEARQNEDFSLVEFNDLALAFEQLIAFTKAAVDNHKQRFGAPEVWEELERVMSNAEKSYGTVS